MKIDAKKYLPQRNKLVKVYFNGQCRKAKRDFPMSDNFRLVDCTHPEQNTNLSVFDAEEWEYVNEQDISNFPPIDNSYQRSMEGEKILKSIKRKNIFIRITSYLTNRINQLK